MATPEADHPGDVTRLLRDASQGDGDAFGRLVELVYSQLNDLAHQRLRHEPPGNSLNTTGLVHEAYLKLAGQTRASWQSREHFFAIASEAMRRVLIDHARRRLRDKRGGAQEHVALDDADHVVTIDEDQAGDLLAIDEALQRLAAFNPEGARIVQLRFFGGLSNDEIATVLDSSERTVRRQWSVAKAWLRRELGPVVRDSWSLTAGAGT